MQAHTAFDRESLQKQNIDHFKYEYADYYKLWIANEMDWEELFNEWIFPADQDLPVVEIVFNIRKGD